MDALIDGKKLSAARRSLRGLRGDRNSEADPLTAAVSQAVAERDSQTQATTEHQAAAFERSEARRSVADPGTSSSELPTSNGSSGNGNAARGAVAHLIPAISLESSRETQPKHGDSHGLDPRKRSIIDQSWIASAVSLMAAMVGPLAAAIVVARPLVFVATVPLVLAVRDRAKRTNLSDGAVTAVAPLAAAVGAAASAGAFASTEAGSWLFELLLAGTTALLAGGLAAALFDFAASRLLHVRVAVIGSSAQAHELAWELESEGIKRYQVVGFVSRDEETGRQSSERRAELRHVAFGVRRLGKVSDLVRLVPQHSVDLLVMSEGSNRLHVFDLAATCSESYRTKLISLGAFHELVFQRVTIKELNSAWLQHLMHPRYRPVPRVITRTIDLLGALVIGLVSMPIALIAALLIKLEDRGPVFYSQTRIGERGKPFTMVKFRSMRSDAEADGPKWSTDNDDRVTRIGDYLRRFHVDELPQLWNVLCGEMSLVGPRPERPEFVSNLEREVPFYSRRHLVKPGVTGWAQVRAGYGRSDEGAAIKLSSDLFYLKHRSVFLDLYVLCATVWTVVMGTVHSRAQ